MSRHGGEGASTQPESIECGALLMTACPEPRAYLISRILLNPTAERLRWVTIVTSLAS